MISGKCDACHTVVDVLKKAPAGTLLCDKCYAKMPYSHDDYEQAKKLGFDLDNWSDYCIYFEIGEREEYNW